MGKITTTLASAVASCTILAGALPAVASGALCEQGVVHDYTKPLRRLPHLRPIPSTGQLPSGPARVFLTLRGGGPLSIGGGEVGYALSYSPRFPEHHLSPPLNWMVEARYVRVDGQGRPLRVRGRIVHRVKRLRSDEDKPSGTLDFLFKAGPPALYRLEITFSDLSGKRLGRYGEYLRVLEPKLSAGLSLNGTAFRPGETVRATADNYGTTSLSFGLGRTIEYFNGASWEPAPNSGQGAIPLPLLRAGPGASAQCWGFAIPVGEPQGLYRFVVEVSSEPREPRSKGEPLTLSSEFHISG